MAYPANGAQLEFVLTSWSVTVSGVPGVTVLPDEPKLARISERTMPDCVNTLGPLVPSPGYGPAVSDGITEHASACNGDAITAAAPIVCSARRRVITPSRLWTRA